MGIGTPSGGSRRSLLWIAGTLLFLPGVPAEPLAGQSTIRGAILEADLIQGPGPIPVTLELDVRPDSEAVDLPLTLLTPEDTRLSDLRASWEGGDLSLRVLQLRPHYWTGTVRLPVPTETPATGDSGAEARSLEPASRSPVTLRIAYRVDGGWEGGRRIVVPVPAPTWVPEDPHPGTFRARVRVPEGLTVTESFPTSVVARPDGAEGGTYEVALQGMPSMLVLRVAQGEAPALTLEGVLDVLVVMVLVLMGLAGLRYLRKGGP